MCDYIAYRPSSLCYCSCKCLMGIIPRVQLFEMPISIIVSLTFLDIEFDVLWLDSKRVFAFLTFHDIVFLTFLVFISLNLIPLLHTGCIQK